ncbi:hypothetical protein ACLMJK_001245 [Lecanora helva]
MVSARASSPDKHSLRSGEPNSFLTALAAQERRVLELREELQKAEGELEKLKKQWASQEAAKKRNESSRLEQLQPLKTFSGGAGISDDDSSAITRDPDRRQMAPIPSKPSQRTVFSGSRHARTLSLLSPRESSTEPSIPSRGTALPRRNRNKSEAIKSPDTIQELSTSTDGSIDFNELYKGPQKDVLLQTGKQLVGDFRQGLWTFFEDLKQVTVGDEAAIVGDPRHHHGLPAESLPKIDSRRKRDAMAKGTPPKEKASDKAISPHNQTTFTSDYPEKSLEDYKVRNSASLVPSSTSVSNHRIGSVDSSSSISDNDDDGWDNWDTTTPRGKQAQQREDAMSSPLTDNSSSRTSTSSTEATPRPERPPEPATKQDDLAWPSLSQFSPEKLTRRASTLMSEWEKSLAPPGDDPAKADSVK